MTADYLAGASYTCVEQAIGKDSALIVLAVLIVALVVCTHDESTPNARQWTRAADQADRASNVRSSA